MGIMYGWTAEYMFNKMSFGQIIMYYWYGSEIKYGKRQKISDKPLSTLSKTEKEVEKERLHKLYGLTEDMIKGKENGGQS